MHTDHFFVVLNILYNFSFYRTRQGMLEAESLSLMRELLRGAPERSTKTHLFYDQFLIN